MRVAIIGAGMTGATAASALADAGAEVTVFDKGRGPGGRMSSKRLQLDGANGGYLQLDMGAQYFTARHPWFLHQVRQWQQQGLVQRWVFAPHVWQHGLLLPSDDAAIRYVGAPAMHQMLRSQLGTLVQHYSCQVTELSYSQSSFSSQQCGEWTVSTADGASYAGFDALLLTCPPEQCRKLLVTNPLAEQLPADLLLPCWAVAIELAEPVTHPAVGIFGKSGALSWCARHNAKPGRPALSEHWVLHLNAASSLQLLEATPGEVAAVAEQAFSQIVGQKLQVTSALCHRWLYASYNAELTPPGVLSEPAQRLVVAGDWSFGGRVENAWLAGVVAASQLLPEQIKAPDLSATAADSMLATQ
ncbi:NAD(P)/FAD-dependent oxidoreductase [Rheinheimera texasensis]|uniref:NAD(P)/FAD-dependent oxidoreductase n=1 Tax=Rheinheimera texasensis TaxID=306205 RepID=UPI00068F9A37|nr:FAD-dependent oxidoreductase [Rheinheimera texasensis]